MLKAKWAIVSNYKAFGLAETVKMYAKAMRKRWKLTPTFAYSLALLHVRKALTSAINDRSFYQA